MKLKNSLFIGCLLISGSVLSQPYSNYTYKRKLNNIDAQWHTIKVPNDMFGRINSDFSDLRVLGIKANGDTIEAPYILKVLSDNFNSELVKFELINQVKNSKGYYYTFEIPDSQFINYINADFKRSNFDWLVTLEGSQNQNEWYTILEESRILSISNFFTSYKYTNMTFEKAKFKYYRLFIPSRVNPKLDNVSIKKTSFGKGEYIDPQIISHFVEETDNGSQTVLFIELKEALPVSFIKLNTIDTIDYYRPITIQYAIDSIENNTGWHDVYKTIYSSTLSSLADNEFRFSNTIIKKLKLIIENGDNEPLNYQSSNIRGDVHQLVARFNSKVDYYLLYGNKQAYMPNYDINRFKTNIPTNLSQVNTGNEIEISSNEDVKDVALIKDDIWLWAVMIIAIFILGWFSIKMIKNK